MRLSIPPGCNSKGCQYFSMKFELQGDVSDFPDMAVLILCLTTRSTVEGSASTSTHKWWEWDHREITHSLGMSSAHRQSLVPNPESQSSAVSTAIPPVQFLRGDLSYEVDRTATWEQSWLFCSPQNSASSQTQNSSTTVQKVQTRVIQQALSMSNCIHIPEQFKSCKTKLEGCTPWQVTTSFSILG